MGYVCMIHHRRHHTLIYKMAAREGGSERELDRLFIAVDTTR